MSIETTIVFQLSLLFLGQSFQDDKVLLQAFFIFVFLYFNFLFNY